MLSRSFLRGAAIVLLAVSLSSALPPGASAQHVLSLQETLAIAMDNSPNVKHRLLRLESSEALLKAQEASLKTQFGLTLGPISYVNTNQFDEFFSTWYRYESYNIGGQLTIEQPIKWTGGTLSLNDNLSWRDSYSEATGGESNATYRNDLYLQFNQPLFTYNSMKMDLEKLELDYESNQLRFEIEQLELERNVMDRFYRLYADKMRLEIAREAMETDRENYNIMKSKYEAGIGRLDDLSQAETDMLTSESSFNNSVVSMANSLDRFKFYIGLPIDDDIDIDTDIEFSPVGVDMEFAVKHGLATRMELREQEIMITDAHNGVISAGATNEFKGSLNLRVGSSGTDPQFDNIYSARQDEQSASLTFQVPIWDWGQKKNRILASENNLKSAKLRLEEEKVEITMDIRESCRELDKLVTQVEIARRRIESAEKTYEINLEKYQNGNLTSQLLGGYRQSLSNARLNEINQLINYRLQMLDLKIKSLWDFENDRAVLTITTRDHDKE